MLFNSLSFILFFLPVSVVFYHLAAAFGARSAAAVLVLFSLLFYCWWNPFFLILICASIAYNYAFGVFILRTADRARLQTALVAAAVAGNLLLLVYYKYLYPLMGWLDSIGWHIPRERDSVILPLGISFFTFTQVGFLIDCKAGIVKGIKLLDYMLFVTFFPHLIAGPILHHREMIPQFANPDTYRFNLEAFCVGIVVFTLGLAKKVLIADHFAPFANDAFAHAEVLGTSAAWFGALAYTIQLYFDFSGYSEMAVGLGLLFGIRLPANFNSPYKSQSIIDFWQRWHMTLTRYLTLYLYNPVALWIARRRLARGQSTGRQAAATPAGFMSMITLPTFYTMALAGIWHGAGLQYLCFGLLHGSYLSVNHACRLWSPKKTGKRSVARKVVDAVWKTTLTLAAVILAQIFFRASSVGNALSYLAGMVGFHADAGSWQPKISPDLVEKVFRATGYDPQPLLERLQFPAPFTLMVVFIWVFTMPNVLQVTSHYKPSLTNISAGTWQRLQWRPTLYWGAALGALAAITLMAVTGTTEFIYFQF